MLERSIQGKPEAGAAIINWAWLALAHLQLGDTTGAREWLAKVTDWIDSHGGHKPEDRVIHLHNWLEALVLRREVQAKLSESPPGPTEPRP